MDPDVVRNILVAAIATGVGLWIATSFVLRVAGTWERVLSDDEQASGQRPERFTLGQLGPMLTGRRDVTGGYQEFSGVMVGRSVSLTRRDHGVPSLTALGFPEAIAKQLDGEVTARLKLKLTDGGLFLEGTFIPQKVEFTHRPPKITGAYYLDPQRRQYRRVIPLTAEAKVPAPLVDDVVDVEPA